jgi:putative thioredoxin
MTTISSTDSPYVLECTDENFEALVLDNSAKGPVMVNFWSPNAGPCLRLYPILDKLVHEFRGQFLLINLNVAAHSRRAHAYGVTSLPTLKLFVQRTVVDTVHGYQTEAELKSVLNRHVALESDRTLRRAVEVYQGGDKERAFRMLAELAIAHPENLRIPLSLGKLLIREQRHEDAYRLLASLPEESRILPEIRDLLAHLGFLLAAAQAPEQPILERLAAEQAENLEVRYQLCAVKLIRDDYEGAMELLLEIMRKDSGFRNGAARNGLLAIFGLLGNQGELVDRYRKLMVQYLH